MLRSKISRRKFIAASGSAAAIGTSFLGLPARAASGVRTLRIASGAGDGPKGTLDPAHSTSDPDAARISLVFERLVVLDETFTPTPQLATSWTTNETADLWTFALRRGVRFHDGETFTAKDVVYTYRRLLDPATASPASSALAPIDPNGIEAVDDATVRFRLKAPVVAFPELIANLFTYIVRDGQPGDRIRTQGLGTGPFKVKQFIPGEEPSLFVKNEQYWQPGLPKVDAVELRSIPDPSARIAAITSGQLDLLWDVPRLGLDQFEKNPDIRIVTIHTPYVLAFSAWTDTPPFDDVRVRQALKLAIDRKQMLQLALGGHGQIAGDSPVAPWVRYGLQDPPKPRDIAQAKRLLAEAGHGGGLEIELHTSEVTSGFIELSTLFQAQVAEAGVAVKLIKEPADGYWSNIWLKKSFVMSSWSGRSADDALSVAYLSDAKWNETHWRLPEYDKYIAEARRTLDEAKRGALYRQAQQMLRDDGGAIIPVFPDAIGATRANVTGWKPHPQQYFKDFSRVDFTS